MRDFIGRLTSRGVNHRADNPADVDIVLRLLPSKRNQASVKEGLFFVQGRKTRLETGDVDITQMLFRKVQKKSTKYERTSIS